MRRYRFTRIVIAGAPDEQGVYALWDGEEVIYYGRRGTIRSRLLDHFYGRVDETTRPRRTTAGSCARIPRRARPSCSPSTAAFTAARPAAAPRARLRPL